MRKEKEARKPSGLTLDSRAQEIFKNVFIARGVAKRRAGELAGKFLSIVDSTELAQPEKNRQIEGLFKEYKVKEVVHPTGGIQIKSVHICGPNGGIRPFPGPIYKR